MSQSFTESHFIARIRPSAIRLFFPFLVLSLTSFAVSFYSGRLPEQWMNIALYSLAGALAFLFWLVPVLRYLSAYVDISSTSILYRSGLMGQHRSEISFSQVTGIEVGRGRKISLSLVSGESVELPTLPKAKQLAAELERLVAAV